MNKFFNIMDFLIKIVIAVLLIFFVGLFIVSTNNLTLDTKVFSIDTLYLIISGGLSLLFYEIYRDFKE